MPTVHPGPVDILNKFEDLSGVDSTSFSNPYDALIETCQDDPVGIQSRYSIHRTLRNAKQKAILLSPQFTELILDTILNRLEDPSIEPGYVDLRNSVVLWARPPACIRSIICVIQERLKIIAPNLWLMPPLNLHMTTLEIAHSVTSAETTPVITKMSPIISTITDHSFIHRVRLIKPLISYDSAALALSFLPAAGESLPPSRPISDDQFTYHHLRRNIFTICTEAGVKIESRYVVPSAHLTIGRFVVQNDHDSAAKRSAWIAELEDINAWLEREYWPQGDHGNKIEAGGEWIIGQEKGLDLRMGTLWYGGGETVRLGRGF